LRDLRPSILAKLVLLATLPTLVAVVAVGAALASRQTRQETSRLEHKLVRDATTAAEQVRSAIAFDDRETAHETLDALAGDPEVVGIQLYNAAGEVLHTHGMVVPPERVARTGTLQRGAQLTLAVPVTSLEGPQGTLALAVSTASVAIERRHAILLTIGVASGALVLALLVALTTARGLSRRIEAVAAVASRVADGDLAVAPLAVRSRDEVDRTAAAVNTMVVRLRELLSREAARTASERERLENMVAERTEQLAERNRANRLVLDHVNQGLVTVTHDGTVVGETSLATARLFGPIVATDKLWAGLPARPAFALEFAFAQLVNEVLPIEMLMDQLPTELPRDGRVLALTYAPIADAHLLVTITDVTVAREQARAREAEHETVALFHSLKSDRHGVRRFVADARAQLAVVATATDPEVMLRPLHTLKGNAALLGLDGWVARCHAAETMLAELGELTSDARLDLAAAWQATESRVAPVLASSGSVEVSESAFGRMIAIARGESSWAQLRQLLHDAVLESATLPLERLAQHCRDLAARRGRDGVDIEIEDDGVRLDPEIWSPLWSVLTHVGRNAVTHGLPNEGAGRLRLRALQRANHVLIEIADNGDGIQWDALAARAREMGLPSGTHGELVAAMFAPHVSTHETIDDAAGRGVGLAAVAETCESLGVRYDVESAPGAGTTFRFWLPDLTATGSAPCASA